jgi:N-acyl homoserine lactone hydrolase
LADIEILPIELGTFTFPADEPNSGEEGVVVAYAIRGPSGVLLFDTGFGPRNDELDERYHPRRRLVADALADVGIRMADVNMIANCHLHVDHAGQNSSIARVPIYVQRREWDLAHQTDHTILEWIESVETDYRQHDGDYEIAPGVRVIATPGHTAGHQSIVVDQPDGVVVLAGQAVYSVGEWLGDPHGREGRSRAPDKQAYDRSIERLRALDPVRVHFAHDRNVWNR